MIFKLGMKHLGMDFYKVYINHDPGMTLTYFTARSSGWYSDQTGGHGNLSKGV